MGIMTTPSVQGNREPLACWARACVIAAVLSLSLLGCVGVVVACHQGPACGGDANGQICFCMRMRNFVYRYVGGGKTLPIPMTGSLVQHLRLLPSHKLIFCDISKNGNQAFSDLLCSIARWEEQPHWLRRLASRWRSSEDFELGCSWFTSNPYSLGISDSRAGRLVAHEEPGWTTAVFVRDPLDRFLSGYLSKCTEGHDPDRHVCRDVFGAERVTWEQAVRRINATEGYLRDGTAEDHFRLQSRFCNGTVGRGELDHYYVLDRETSRANVIDMLSHAGIDAPLMAPPAFGYHFPRLEQEQNVHAKASTPASAPASAPASTAGSASTGGTARRSRRGSGGGAADPDTDRVAGHHYGFGTHFTHAETRRAKYYSDPAVVAAVLRHYAPDYQTLPLAVPDWAVELVGADYVRSLGL